MALITKTRFLGASRCMKCEWLGRFRPEAASEADPAAESLIRQGLQVGAAARQLLPGCVTVDADSPGRMAGQTRALIDQGVTRLAEASFLWEDLFFSADLLEITGPGRAALTEVKSGTRVNKEHILDAAFQVYVLQKLGWQVERVEIAHINSGYVREGGLDIQRLFQRDDRMEAVMKEQAHVAEVLDRIRAISPEDPEPGDCLSVACADPYRCHFWDWCTRELPRPGVFDVTGVSAVQKFKLYREGEVTFADLARVAEKEKLTAAARMQLEHELRPQPPHIDREAIRGFLSGLRYPLYFLDFESFMPAIPRYDQSCVYSQIVFQYSLHIQPSPEAEPEHLEYLAPPGADPRRGVAERLCADIPADACVLAYNMSFEKTRLQELAELYPDLAEHLLAIRDHTLDLMTPFLKKWYYCRAMQGSYSIKHVLPALFPDDPEMDYRRLEGVHNGLEASEAFAGMEELAPEELERTRRNLLKYCGLDTYAMVKVWRKLLEAAEADGA